MWWLAMASAAPCGDVGALSRSAKEAVLGMDLEQAVSDLDDAEAALACGPVASVDLGLMWLVRGAVYGFQGEGQEAKTAFAAAARVAPDLWVVDFGPDLQAQYQQARRDQNGKGELEVTDLPEGFSWLVDGQEHPLRVELPAGLHAVQAGPSSAEVGFGKVVRILDGETLSVPTGLEATTNLQPLPAPARTPDPSPNAGKKLLLHGAAGVESLFGASIERRTAKGERVTEPSVKLLIPLELGVRLDLDTLWFRVAVGGGPLVTGPLIYETAAGIQQSRATLHWHLGAGTTVGEFRLGGMLGAVLPGRQTLRGVGGYALTDALGVEIRMGLNRVADRGFEGAGALMLSFTPTLAEL